MIRLHNLALLDEGKLPERCERSAQHNGLYHKEDPCQLQHWYPLIRDYTFATEFVPLSLVDAKALKYLCSLENRQSARPCQLLSRSASQLRQVLRV